GPHPHALSALSALATLGALRRRASYAKTRPASACRLGVRVLEHEPAAEQARVVVERRPVEQPMTARIDPHAHALRSVENQIRVLRRRLPREDVLKAGAAAGLHADAEPGGVLMLLVD